MCAFSDRCAQEILDVVPLIMRTLRAEMRGSRGPDLSVPMFRALAYLDHYEGASLTEVAAHLGVTLPSMSKMVDGLETRELVTRWRAAEDRRRVTLVLTKKGRELVAVARQATQKRLAELLSVLSDEECEGIVTSLRNLSAIFGDPERPRQKG